MVGEMVRQRYQNTWYVKQDVRASHGFAGGIAGETNGNVICAVNRSAEVIAYEGTAGGITAVNTKRQDDSKLYELWKVTK